VKESVFFPFIPKTAFLFFNNSHKVLQICEDIVSLTV